MAEMILTIHPKQFLRVSVGRSTLNPTELGVGPVMFNRIASVSQSPPGTNQTLTNWKE